MQQHGWNLWKLDWAKEARHKRVQAIGFYFYEALENAELICDKNNQNWSCLLIRDRDCLGRGQEGTFDRDVNVLHLHRGDGHINLSICQKYKIVYLRYMYFNVRTFSRPQKIPHSGNGWLCGWNNCSRIQPLLKLGDRYGLFKCCSVYFPYIWHFPK